MGKKEGVVDYADGAKYLVGVFEFVIFGPFLFFLSLSLSYSLHLLLASIVIIFSVFFPFLYSW